MLVIVRLDLGEIMGSGLFQQASMKSDLVGCLILGVGFVCIPI